jgi:hypothetical protein
MRLSIQVETMIGISITTSANKDNSSKMVYNNRTFNIYNNK